MNSLLLKLKKEASEAGRFHIMFGMINEHAEQERMREARELEAEGYIKLERCTNIDIVNNSKCVTIAGRLTEKGMK